MEEQGIDESDLEDQFRDAGLNVFVTAYVNKKTDKLSWTFNKVRDTFLIVGRYPVN